MSTGARDALRERVRAAPELIGSTQELWLPADDEVDMYWKGYVDRELPEAERRLSDQQLAWIEVLDAQGRIRVHLRQPASSARETPGSRSWRVCGAPWWGRR